MAVAKNFSDGRVGSTGPSPKLSFEARLIPGNGANVKSKSDNELFAPKVECRPMQNLSDSRLAVPAKREQVEEIFVSSSLTAKQKKARAFVPGVTFQASLAVAS
jgi:hypothetical protein